MTRFTSLTFLVSGVLPAEPAELSHLEALGRLLLVLRRTVVATLALHAGHRDDVAHGLLHNLGHRPGTDGAAALTNREARTLFERHRRHQLAGDRRVVARHHHLDAFGKMQSAGNVGRPDLELRTVDVEEGRVTAGLLFRVYGGLDHAL